MRTLAALAAALFAPMLHAQQLLVPATAEEPSELIFNPAFIARQGIRSISGKQMVKREGRPMVDKAEKHLYRFDAQGRLVYGNTSYGRPGTGLDTASIGYFYDAKGRLVQRLRNDLSGHFAYEITCDSLGRTVRQAYVRIENLGPDRYHLVPGNRSVISDEQLTWSTVNDTAWKCTWLNERGLPYREQLYQRDRLGYLRAIDDRYLVTGRRGRITFTYDEKGRLAERTDQPDLRLPSTDRMTWRYDTVGNVVYTERWHDDRLRSHDEYLYEEETLWLKAVLTKDEETGLIHVVRYTTER
jgi:YD repeat-containing protein